MNWEVFSTVGYVSVALWLCVPLLWLLHLLIRPRRWLAHIALVVGIGALVLATVNSKTHVGRIQVDRSAQIQEQMSRQAMARQAAEDDRADEVAPIRFAEDASGEYFDTAGLDEADLKYFESFSESVTPAWKREKKQRSTDDADPDDLESLIGAGQEREGIDVPDIIEEQEEAEPILMSDADKLTADRLDKANLSISRVAVLLAVLFITFDYVRRLNRYEEVYFPLPLPSGWSDALSSRPAELTLPAKPRRSLMDELRVITRRGEVFVYYTDNAESARNATVSLPRLPAGCWPIHVLRADGDPKLDDTFVFETLWFGRHSFVVGSPERAQAMIHRFTELLSERLRSRAHTRRTVHVVWDLAEPIPEQAARRFVELAAATGFVLIINPSTPNASREKERHRDAKAL